MLRILSQTVVILTYLVRKAFKSQRFQCAFSLVWFHFDMVAFTNFVLLLALTHVHDVSKMKKEAGGS